MAVQPVALEFDQTPNKLLAQQAQEDREMQRQQTLLKQKDDMIRAEAFGSAQKQLIDISKAEGLPSEVQKMIIDKGLTELTQMYRDPRYRSVDMGVHASSALKQALEFSNAFSNYNKNGQKFIADLKESGFDEVSLKAALANSMFTTVPTQTPAGVAESKVPKDPAAIGDPMEFLLREKKDNPQKYFNRKVGDETLSKVIQDFKPGEFKYASTKDLTGMKTLKIAYTTKSYPWTEEREYEDPATKQKVKYNVLSTEPLTDDKGNKVLDKNGNEIPILSGKAFDYFNQLGNPVLSTQIDVMGRDAIDDHNRAILGNSQVVTPENFDALHEQNPNLVNPFDAGNRRTYSRLAMSKRLMPQFGKTGEVSVTSDQARPVTVRVGGGDDMYTKGGTLRPELKFPAAWAQMVEQDATVMRVGENSTFTFEGKTMTGRRVGDRAQGQILKDNGKRATVVVKPGEIGTVYVVEIDEDGELTDNVEKLTGQKAIDYGARISTANGSDPKTFEAKYPVALKTVIKNTDADIANYNNDVNLSAQKDAGKTMVANSGLFLSMKDGETKDVGGARVKLKGQDVVVKSVTRKKTNWYSDSPIEVLTTDGKVITFANKNEFKEELDKNK